MGQVGIGEIITGAVLGAAIIGTVFIAHERSQEEQSLLAVIRAEVKAEVERQYRNVPRIEVEKVYTLHATGRDVVIDAERNERGARSGEGDEG